VTNATSDQQLILATVDDVLRRLRHIQGKYYKEVKDLEDLLEVTLSLCDHTGPNGKPCVRYNRTGTYSTCIVCNKKILRDVYKDFK